ncbi:MAG: flagellar protein MotY [Cellvibrionaceae bacterium]
MSAPSKIESFLAASLFTRLVVMAAIVAIALIGSVSAQARPYQASLGDSAWVVDSSIFECRIVHDIPYYGRAVFEHLAGYEAKFQLRPQSPLMKSGKASLVSAAPHWKPAGKSTNLGLVPVTQGRFPVTLKAKQSARMLSELFEGQDLVFTRAPWYGAEQSAKVVLSPVNFQAPYLEYQACQAQLLPVNFEQIRRTAIYFPSSHDRLLPSELKKLDDIALYVKADDSVQSFYVDGHTDSLGGRGDNLELSQKRAEMVVQFLVDRGIASDKITSRWHGERYPVASNRSRKGRAQNRRVTIRLEKNGAPTIPPLAQAETP